ncbi:hypothetical protein BAS10_10060 [Elizabethkingia meningoseptica]|uniref:hypothetical protein n=1 Tax=Elizabethkingia meningoseptica TaxID=238 RepID=UPI000999E359|nr:hypothetical protein [Elizabethkingia meningoseptica]OPB95685.1 hypothetical protein BAS10_10060 [Elizabethkingia meningoseptica]
MKKLQLLVLVLPILSFAQLATPLGQVQSTSNPETKNIGIGTINPESILDIRANESIPIIRGNGGYIPTGLRFIDDSYTQPGQVKEWAIWKGNTFTKGLSFMRYDAVNRCQGGICSVALQLNDNGNVGIGTSSPFSRLEVYNEAGKSHLTLSADDNNANDMSRIDLDYKIYNRDHIIGRISSFYWDSGNGGTGGLKFYTREAGQLTAKMIIAPNGNISVNNKLEAREIKVTTTPTADFVFEDHYKLPDLESVEKHIREKKHLPEIASAAEMQKEGVNIGDFQIKLLQKIEELTLYSIEQNKQNKQQQERILKLEEEVKALSHR